MKSTNTLIIIFLIIIIGCEKNDDGTYGKIVFYTNAQAMLNCGPFDVNVYIDDKRVGSLSNPVFNNESELNCTKSKFTIVINRPPGHYTCKATACSSLVWHNEIDVIEGTCTNVFLDIYDFRVSDGQSTKRIESRNGFPMNRVRLYARTLAAILGKPPGSTMDLI